MQILKNRSKFSRNSLERPMSELPTHPPALIPPSASAKAKRKSKKKDPATITPEYIEEQRRLRQLKKEQRAQDLKLEAQTVPPALQFVKREFAAIPGQEPCDGLPLKIMSYNLLAQALIRRKLFPTSGNALKWGNRSTVLMNEFTHYNADIMCLQEVDYVQYNSHWQKFFEKAGYDSKYYRDLLKNHGVAIVYRKDWFVCRNQSFIRYDEEKTGDILPRTITQNVGFLAYLEFTPSILQKHPGLRRNGIIVGTTHLFWHPFGTYERSRQTYVVLKKFKEFYQCLDTLSSNKNGFYSFFAGDFNSQPFDTPYLSITAKPISYSGRGKTVISCSLLYQYSKNRGVVEGAEDEEEDETEKKEEEGGNVEKFGKDQPKDPVPESFVPTEQQLQLVSKMESLHNELDMRAVSLYSIGYKQIDPNNAGFDNDRNEPIFSNWAHAWRGLLDYIFIITKWDKTHDYSQKVDSLDEVEARDDIKLVKLLKLPMPEDMGPEPSGQPRAGQYPSDHLCLMAEVILK